MMEHAVFPEVGQGFYLVLVKSGWREGSFSSLFSLLDLNREYGWCSDVVVESPVCALSVTNVLGGFS